MIALHRVKEFGPLTISLTPSPIPLWGKNLRADDFICGNNVANGGDFEGRLKC